MNISRRLDDVLLMALCFCTVVHTGHSSLHLQEILEGEDVEDRDCVTAKNACLSRRTCRDALVLTMTQCQGIVANPVRNSDLDGNVVRSFDPPYLPTEPLDTSCPTGCQQALASLLSSEAGQDLAKCRCGPTHTLCHDIRRRLNASCHAPLQSLLNHSPDRPLSPFPSTPLSCRMAEAMCNGDTACSLALDYHHVLCRKMFQGQFCSFKCRNSLEVLLNQTYGQALRHCHCTISPPDAAYHCRQRYQSHRELCTAGYTIQHPSKGHQYENIFEGLSKSKIGKFNFRPYTKGHQAQEEIMRLVRLEDTDGQAGLKDEVEEEERESAAYNALMSNGLEDEAENIRPLDNALQRSHLDNGWPWLTLPSSSRTSAATSTIRLQPVITNASPLFLTLFLHLCLCWQL